jgi:uncharacterized protein YecE (DUF72 family)
MAAKGKALIGTSGFYYKHWMDNFYPEGVKPKDFFEYYQQYFSTVELNSPFYRLPNHSTFLGWKEKTSENFVFAVKASRYITHIKKLNDSKEALDNLLERADLLEDRLGPVLFQLPPGWKYNGDRFRQFLKILPRGYRFTFEFRNHSWYNEEVYELLEKKNYSFCIYELEHHMSPIITTADFVYVRLHGPDGKYQGLYSDSAMEWWAEQIRIWQKKGKDVYFYFDNDQNGYAAFNAQTLKKLVSSVSSPKSELKSV